MLRSVTVACLIAVASCNDGSQAPDDLGNSVGDAGTPDGGKVGTLCPASGAACQKAADCEADHTAESNCGFCRPWNTSVCDEGTCATPSESGAIDLGFKVEATIANRVKSFGALVLDKRTGGGSEITCAQLKAGLDLGNGCYNILSSKSRENATPGEETYHILFNRIATVDAALFAIYGFEQHPPSGTPIAFTCREGPITTASQAQIDGDTLRLIQ